MTRAPAAHNGTDGRIVVDGLSKVFGGGVRAVDRLTFTVEPGSVTGFLGPNGAGKTTTLRMILGLVTPTEGTATVGGVPYRHLPHPLSRVGAALEASDFHPSRTGRNHLRVICTAAGIPLHRADAVLDLVGLSPAAKRKVRGYSLGMRQRLGLAAALLGDPRVLVLDEPANGLDPDGIRWLRTFFRRMAAEGRTVLVSSHQLGEVQEIADRVVILNQGRLVQAGSIKELSAGSESVIVRAPDPAPLGHAVAAAGGFARHLAPDTLEVRGLPIEHVGHLAFTAGVELHELSSRAFDLEDLFFSLTSGTGPGQVPGPAMAPAQGAHQQPLPQGAHQQPLPQGAHPQPLQKPPAGGAR